MSLDRDKIKSNGWVQGAIFQNETENGLPKGTYFVLTQDCDLLHHSTSEEPFVELMQIQQIADSEVNGNFTKTKNPRTLHLRLTLNSNPSKYYELAIKDQHKIDRSLLTEHISPAKCEEQEKNIVVSWWKSKYDRAAFPDNFNRRLTSEKFKEKLEKKIKKFKDEIEAIYLRLNTTQELPDDEPYHIVRLIIEVTRNASESTRKELKDLLEWMVDNIPASIIIDPNYHLLTDEEITKADLKDLQELALGYLSLE